MRELVESVKSLYEIKLGLNDIKNDIPIEQVKHEKKKAYEVDGGDGKKYHDGGDEDIEYSTSHGKYTGTRTAGGNHTVTYTPSEENSPHDWGSGIRGGEPSMMYNTNDRLRNTQHLRHMNALHNHYVKNHVLPNDTLSIAKNNDDSKFETSTKVNRREKLYGLLKKHKDFHAPDESEKDNDDQLRTTYIRHPSSGKPVGTSDSNEYAINRKGNIKASQLVNKDTVDSQKEYKPSLTNRVKRLMNTKIF
jgi:hypothetical protein